MNKLFYILAILSMPHSVQAQQADAKAYTESSLSTYFSAYTSHNSYFATQPRLEKLSVDEDARSVVVSVSSSFAQQSFDDKTVGRIYRQVKKSLARPLRRYDVEIVCNGLAIECYVPGYKLAADECQALWGKIDYKGQPWITNASRPFTITLGLAGRHITLWASHGRVYNNDKRRWEWQRPNLFSTTEDLFTQTIVNPFLVPMLERSGACVFTPRERDWQRMEYIVDPDGGLNCPASSYKEYSEQDSWTGTGTTGFAAHNGVYEDKDNPFAAGSARKIKTTKKQTWAYSKWQPYFVSSGRYAVYVSYKTLSNSVDDAHYTVFHQGIATEFTVNQRMGGDTWVYLGTFDFDEGSSVDNCVMLTNQSRQKGVVTADAVRFGGGMGNMSRGGKTSGMPRSVEAARYAAQWAGAPYSVYSSKDGADDYADDINVRSLMSNWLSGGSVYNPVQEGKGVPLELSLAIHSDAGYAKDGKGLWGSLAVCTTDFNDGRLASGITRQISKIFATHLLDNAVSDLSRKYKTWPRRYLWDRNYSETRLPAVPSAILETVSHQNFPDMALAQDPNFKFDLARSVYKTIARFVNGMHGEPTVIQPLAPQNVAVALHGTKATVSWTPQADPLEPSATPSQYIIYTAIGNGGFDNGVSVNRPSFDIELQPGIVYSFRVAAANRGGESFPSEVVSAVYEPRATKKILVVNGFHRLAAPAIVDNGQRQGFDLGEDIGVAYGLTAGWSGKQTCFNMARMGRESSSGLGYSGNELAGTFIAGNTFDYVRAHAQAMAKAHEVTIVSCSSKAVETGIVNMGDYDAVDLILGLEKYSPNALKYYKTFTPSLQKKITDYTRQSGKIMVSGAYIASDMDEDGDRQWLEQTFHLTNGGKVSTDTISNVKGMGLEGFDFCRSLNEKHYSVQHSDKLMPISDSFCSVQYSDGSPAAVAYDGNDYKTFALGFPLECITDKEVMANIVHGIITFLLSSSK